VEIVLYCFAANESQMDQTLKVQTTHGSNVILDNSGPVINATTTFVSDASTVSAHVSHASGPTLGLAKKSQIPNVEDIKRFLAKPVVIRTGVFQSTDTVSTFAPIAAMENFLLQAMPGAKIAGFLGIRATIVLRIVVNANRFQQGRYQLAWIPLGGQSFGNRTTAFINAHANQRKQRSQLHRVEIDLNCDTEGELVIPYSSALNWYPTRHTTVPLNSAGELGVIGLYPYVALTAASGSLTAGFKIYMHLEDVELFGAAVPQMGRKLSRVVKRNASEIEAKNAGIGPVESAMNMGSQISNALSVVPILTPFAKPASWVFDALGGVAAAFGWSKPANLSQAHRVVMQNAPYIGSVNNDDYALPLSLDVKNYVEPIPMGISDVDEMDFLALCSIPTWISTVSWTTSQVSGTLLSAFSATPKAGELIDGTVIHHTPLSYIASHFYFWRGSLFYKIKVVKTEFHSGRIVICFNPVSSVSGSTPAETYANSVYVQRTIYDIRECNEIIYEVPYTSILPYLNTGILTSKASSCGNINIYVEDLLVAPTAVSSSVSLIVEMYAGPDIEFAYPTNVSWTPNYDTVPQMGDMLQRNDCRLDDGQTTLPHPHDYIDAASKCIGEKIRSFRSLLKSYNTVNSRTLETAAGFWYVDPFTVPLRINSATPVEPDYLCDLYGSLHGLYLYSRGGVRMAFQDRDVATDPVNTFSRGNITVTREINNSVSNSFAHSTNSPPGTSDQLTTGGLKVLGRTTSNQPVQVTVTALNQTVARLCNEQFVTSSGTYPRASGATTFIGNNDRLRIGPTSQTAPYNRTLVKYRAGADDCDFSYFISVMPMSRELGQ